MTTLSPVQKIEAKRYNERAKAVEQMRLEFEKVNKTIIDKVKEIVKIDDDLLEKIQKIFKINLDNLHQFLSNKDVLSKQTLMQHLQDKRTRTDTNIDEKENAIINFILSYHYFYNYEKVFLADIQFRLNMEKQDISKLTDEDIIQKESRQKIENQASNINKLLLEDTIYEQSNVIEKIEHFKQELIELRRLLVEEENLIHLKDIKPIPNNLITDVEQQKIVGFYNKYLTEKKSYQSTLQRLYEKDFSILTLTSILPNSPELTNPENKGKTWPTILERHLSLERNSLGSFFLIKGIVIVPDYDIDVSELKKIFDINGSGINYQMISVAKCQKKSKSEYANIYEFKNKDNFVYELTEKGKIEASDDVPVEGNKPNESKDKLKQTYTRIAVPKDDRDIRKIIEGKPGVNNIDKNELFKDGISSDGAPF